MGVSDILIYVVLPLGLACYFFLKRKYAFFEEQGIPFTKPSMIFGNMKGVGTKTHFADNVKRVYEENKSKGAITGFFTMFSPSYVVTDLELVKHITVKDFNNFVDRGVFSNEEEPLTGNLFSTDGETWRFLRNKLSPVFTSGKIKMMFEQISSKGTNFVDAIDKTSKLGSIDAKDISNRFTIDTISSVAFGMETNTLSNEHPEVISIFKQIFGEGSGPTLVQLILFAFPNFAKLFKLRQFNKTVTKFFNDVIGDSIHHRETNNVVRNDFLNMLIQLKNKGSIEGEISTETRKLTLDECIAQAFIFFFAGADTSSTVIAYALTQLSLNQEFQEKLRNEIVEKTRDSKGELTYENIHEMTYLNQVVSETLRMYPPAFITVRQAAEEYPVPGTKHVITAGCQVMIPNICIHYDERYWTKPEDFNPDRFTTEEIAKRPNLAYMPFGEGPRNCIGMR